jgi:tRNA dimethylallyltransferase
LKNHYTNKAKILITIAGPTAVGKTDLTLKLAQKYDSHIFSADSRQLYRELKIGTAKPTSDELNLVKHHFIDHISIEEAYNAGRYEREADALFKDYFESHSIGILAGGTGMYIKAVLEGLDDFPEVDENVKASYEKMLIEEGITSLQTALKQKDPDYAEKVDLSNSRRLIRALSVIDSNDATFTSFLNQKQQKELPFRTINICLLRNREELYNRINQRVDLMMEEGLLQEVENLKKWQDLKSLQTVGYSELFKYFNAELTLPEAIDLIKRNSRRYAKRQMTWFRNQGNWDYFDAEDRTPILDFINAKLDEFKQN